MSVLDLTNHFLIAMPAMADPNFSQSVTFVCAHSEEGAMGIVINRPLSLQLGEVFGQMDIEGCVPASETQAIYQGGPVQTDRGFILHSPADAFDSTMQVTADIALSTSRDILEAMSQGQGPAQTLVALGYAGWAAGQLEQEMQDNAWLSGPAEGAIIFDTPVQDRWANAAKAMGVDFGFLSNDVGHA